MALPLTLRTVAEIGKERIGVAIPKGTVVEVLRREREDGVMWCRCEYRDKKGVSRWPWIAASELEAVK